jgi:hypothetical protein
MADGTSPTTVGSAPADAAELVPAAELDDDVGAAAADEVDDVVLLLPQPTMAAAHPSASAADSHVRSERIALLLFESQKRRAG